MNRSTHEVLKDLELYVMRTRLETVHGTSWKVVTEEQAAAG